MITVPQNGEAVRQTAPEVTTGVQIGVGVGVGLPGVGVGVCGGGRPAHTLSPMIVRKLFDTVELLEPPPQLMISAAARKDSTGTSTRHRRRQIIEH